MTHTLSPQVIANIRKGDRTRVRAALDASVRAGRGMASRDVAIAEVYLGGGITSETALDMLGVEQTFESKIFPGTVDRSVPIG